MKILSFTLVISFLVLACEAPNKADASVPKVQGLYVFILSEPKVEYSNLGTIQNDLVDQVQGATKGKKFGEALKGILGTTAQNTDFQKLLENMVTLAKEQYPTAEALIFRNNMSNCEVIDFKELQQ